MKKKIIFMIINMNVGGTEKALLNMIAEIPKGKYEITILMLEKYGDFLSSIPSEVKVEYLNHYQNMKDILNNPPHKTALQLLKLGKLINAFNIFLFHLLSKACKDRSIFFKYILNNYPEIEKEYDIAVAYAGPMEFISYFVTNKIKAKKRIQWIHFDVTKIGFDKHFASKNYKRFDKIFVVSEEARKKLISLVPIVKENSEVFHNIVSSKVIQRQAKEGIGFDDDFDGIRILTIGRLTMEKGQDLAISVMARLINEGFNVKWYCVGEGNARESYEKLIDKYSLNDKFILLGSDSNPYPYLEQSDIYVQPSRYEGYCITLIEARCLHKPIVTTDVNGAREQINNGKTGLIVNIEENDLYYAVKKLIINPDLRAKFTCNLAKEKFDTFEIKKFIEFSNHIRIS
ncbi:glycosyltransferase [Metabacillus rhizolycopersici]|uniref:Glycosyltransferase n=1 Tax=Metabacillus rhizolycopersici TaxID=2875709 RepID=A0ABS7UP41_9BACI|nr:glycosyltransferase [Metabacillus rhizolycopersici]MBZ5749694.1 glycosyltransferase [Metabacillus rhizolycopersici]